MFRIRGTFTKAFFSGCLALVALLPSGNLQAKNTATVLYAFAGGKDGAYPHGGLLRDGAGNIYGAATAGGRYGAGAIFEITMAGRERVLYSFTGGNDGGGPYAGLLEHSDEFYGTTSYGGINGFGTVFEITRRGAEVVLHSLAGTDGEGPVASLVMDRAGNLFGTALGGGTHDAGTVFRVYSFGRREFSPRLHGRK